jgi:hypothetical protein
MRKQPSIQLQHRIHNCIQRGFFRHRNKIGENRKISHDQKADLLLKKPGVTHRDTGEENTKNRGESSGARGVCRSWILPGESCNGHHH